MGQTPYGRMPTKTHGVGVVTATSEKSPTNQEGGDLAVSTTAILIPFSAGTKSISISFPIIPGNNGFIYIGGSDIAVDGSNAHYQLLPGSSIGLDYDSTNNSFYAIATVADQVILRGAVL